MGLLTVISRMRFDGHSRSSFLTLWLQKLIAYLHKTRIKYIYLFTNKVGKQNDIHDKFIKIKLDRPFGVGCNHLSSCDSARVYPNR